MKNTITLLLVLISFYAKSQISPYFPPRTPSTNQPQRVIQDTHLRAWKSFWIPYTNSTTPSVLTIDSVGSNFTASVFLEYSTDSGVTWIIVSQAVNSSSVALTIALTQPSTFNLSGFVPANSLVRLRSTTAGTATVTYTRGQEVYI